MSSGALETPLKKARTCGGKAGSVVVAKETGNKKQAMVKEGQGMLVQELIVGLQEDLKNNVDILPVYNHYKKYKKICEEYADCGEDDMWKDLSTIKGVDETFVMQWLEGHSDLTYDDILEIQANQNPLLSVLFQYAVQLNRKKVLPEALRRHVVMTKFLGQRDIECGQRLATFKKDGGFSDKRVDKNKIIGYAIHGEPNSHATQLVHKATGDTHQLTPDDGLKVGAKIEEAHDDFHAYFLRPPKHRVRLAEFFENQNGSSVSPRGPFKLVHYEGKNFKNMAIHVSELVASHGKAVAEVKGTMHLDESVAQKIAKVQGERHTAQMKKAREAAAKAMMKSKDECAVTLSAPPVAAAPN